VDELGAELDRSAQAREAARPAAAADAAAGFENQHRAAGVRELVGCGKPRGACPDDDYFAAQRLAQGFEANTAAREPNSTRKICFPREGTPF
jgi:hypothetical protein